MPELRTIEEQPFTVELCVLFFFFKQILCRQLPTRGLELIVGGLPSTGSYGALQDGFRFAALMVLRLFWIIEFVQWISHLIIAKLVLEVNSSQLTTAQLRLFKWSIKSSTAPEFADVPSAARNQSFWFPRWVDPDILDVSSQFWYWLRHQMAANNTGKQGHSCPPRYIANASVGRRCTKNDNERVIKRK